VLTDVLVVDLTRALAGPQATMMLGDLGARVIKVESAEGDDSRSWGPPFVGKEGAEESTYFLSCNRNKESVTADLKDPSGVELLTRLVRQADVLIENFRPGVLDRLGFGVERLHELNPRLVICSITGFGHDGPEGTRAGYDQIAQGESGLMSLTGLAPDAPTKVGVPIGDLLAGMNAAFGIVAALHERTSTGKGRVVRTSLLAGLVGVHAFQGTRYTVAGQVPAATGNHHPSISPYGSFRTADAPIQIAVASDSLWTALAAMIGLPAPPSPAGGPPRARPPPPEAGIPAGKIRDLADVYEWDQTRSQGLLVDVEHESLGRVTLPGPPLRFDDNQHAGARTTNLAPPRLGQHNRSVVAWLDEVESAGRPAPTGSRAPAGPSEP
jgi:crotonobetainyl-CoA:carnitine CoA-transferase CaiB-like acyl-CoA transferase